MKDTIYNILSSNPSLTLREISLLLGSARSYNTIKRYYYEYKRKPVE